MEKKLRHFLMTCSITFLKLNLLQLVSLKKVQSGCQLGYPEDLLCRGLQVQKSHRDVLYIVLSSTPSPGRSAASAAARPAGGEGRCAGTSTARRTSAGSAAGGGGSAARGESARTTGDVSHSHGRDSSALADDDAIGKPPNEYINAQPISLT